VCGDELRRDGTAETNCTVCPTRLGEGGGATGTYYGGPAFRNGARVPAMLHTFLSFSVVSLFVDCTNLTLSDRAQVT